MLHLTLTQILALLADIAANPYAQVAVALILLSVIPNSKLERLPVIGNTVRAFLDAWARKKLRDYAEQQQIIQTEAQRIVAAKEQLIKIGRVDAPTAKAQAVQELISTFNLSTLVADRFVESEVHHLQSPLQLISGQALSAGSDLN